MSGLAALILLTAGLALANPPTSSPRPAPRVDAVGLTPVVQVGATPAVVTPRLRPRSRPDERLSAPAKAVPQADAIVQTAAVVAPAAREKAGLFGFLRPSKRPEDLSTRKLAAVKVKPGKQAVVSKKGSVCGVPEIKGETLAPIPARIKGCGIANPVRVASVAGVRLSTPATVNCDAAKALNTWVKRGVEPVYGKGKVVQLEVAASYVCRPRNGKKGAKVSEHGRGNAIDISGLTLSNGKSVSVLQNYDKKMRSVHKAACGIFGTTLGPGSDGYHENHLHFDVARYRNGAYCR